MELSEQISAYNELVQLTLNAGAAKAVVIPQSSIVLSAEFRDICKTNACGCYGGCWVCPPDTGEIDAAMAHVRQYPFGLLYQTIGNIEDSFDIEGMQACAKKHAQVSIAVHKAVKPLFTKPIYHLGCGGCHLCDRCARRDQLPCRHPDLALPAMEGCGINVYQTVKDTSLKYINGTNTVTFFGLVLWEA